MIPPTVPLQVVPGCRDEFLAAIKENAERSFADDRLPLLRRRL
ncbi:hypothetical protein QFW82_35995 [Streptomyces malaysiensis subsp. malaysiensis]|nr:hypothetical protein [Streptomyces sp. NA07423]WHX24488.1 hypothetical protein QFW82_35995 [Streptomyces sp. NA07423]